MVGLSGGKDSWALIQILDVLRRRAPIEFSLVAVTVDSGYNGYRHDLISRTCEERGWEYRIEHTEIGETIDDMLEASDTPCSLCARLRRGVLYRLAKDVGATKIALGHHLDDFIETLLLNLFFAGALKAMPARLVSDNGEHVVIRPLVYATESEARNYAKASAADHRLLLPGVRRPEPAAAADQAADRRARGRASRGQELDDPGARQRRRPPPARQASEPFAGAARGRASRRRRAAAAQAGVEPVSVLRLTQTSRPAPRTSTNNATNRSVRVDNRAVRGGARPRRSSGRW